MKIHYFWKTFRFIYSWFQPFRRDLYHWLLILSWTQFLLLVCLLYLAVNVIFALFYMVGTNSIANAESKSFRDAFFFSIQTMSTVGYGSMYPESLYAQIMATVEVLVGLLLMAILTGLMFARFSRPTARVIFSKVAVICPYNGVPTLMFRTANQRENRILQAEIEVTFLKNEVSAEGYHLRRFYDLQLVRSHTPVFGLSWLIMHPILPESPLYGCDAHSITDSDAEIWVTLTGLDETFSQTIHSRHHYYIQDLIWNYRFVDIFTRDGKGKTLIDISKLSDIIPLDPLP